MVRKFCTFLITALLLIGTLATPNAWAALPSTTAIKDARILLRNALPINNVSIRDVQGILEAMHKEAKLKRWSSLRQMIGKVEDLIMTKKENILQAIKPIYTAEAIVTYQELQNSLPALHTAIDKKKRLEITPLSEKSLEYVTTLEEAMVQQFPFPVPDAYAALPQLRGRATVEIVTNKGTLRLVLDGYNAPVNAGQFADLVQRGFYDGLSFNRADDNFYVQAGDPEGAADGFIDPATNTIRSVPIEIRIPNRGMPIYGKTLADAGLERVLPVLPFSAYGTLAMAHSYENVNGGSSQFFLYLFESDLTPAGLNLMDGNYTVFGYLLEGVEVLRNIHLGDQILTARLVSGAENLQQPALAKSSS